MNVPAGAFENEIVHLRTTVVHRRSLDKKPVLVFIHGFCGSGALFYKIYQYLIDHFTVVFVDLPGMGGSDHPKDFNRDPTDLQQSVDYFVGYLERWRKAFRLNTEKILDI